MSYDDCEDWKAIERDGKLQTVKDDNIISVIIVPKTSELNHLVTHVPLTQTILNINFYF